MAYFWLMLVSMWTALFLAVLGSRAVTGPRTWLRFWLLGVLGGPMILGVARSWIPSAAWSGFLIPALLFVPVCWCLLWNRAYRSLSVSDGFLLGFFVGFGADWIQELFGIGFRDVARQVLPNALSLMPPGILDSPNSLSAHHYAQHGYWLALPSIVLCAGLRFKSKPVAAGLTGAALIFCGLDRIAWQGILRQHSAALETIFLHGLLLPWAAILALVALSAVEARWVARGIRSYELIFRLPLEWAAALSALADRRFGFAANLADRFRLIREIELVRRERFRGPADEAMAHLEASLERRLSPLPDPKAAADHAVSTGKRWPQMAVVTIAAFLVLIAPRLPEAVQRPLWAGLIKLPGYYGSEIPALALILLGFVGWFYLVFGTAIWPDKDEAARTGRAMRRLVERWIWALCLAGGCFLLLYRSYGEWREFISFSSPILEGWNLNLDTDFTRPQWVVYLAALMALAAAGTLGSALESQAESAFPSKAALRRHLLTLTCVLPWVAAAWLLDMPGFLAQALSRGSLAGGWDYRLANVLTITLVLAANWGTRRFVNGFINPPRHGNTGVQDVVGD
ncbi:MAG: hypothetical protein IT160_19555 [Bryobacterales bacterium]|nr:hypothetical protein [Bryobacterales bacterium]